MNPFPEHILLNGKKTPVKDFMAGHHELLHLEALASFLKEWYAPEDYIEVQTSGSTGTPKTIRLKKEFVAQSARRTIDFFNLREGDSVLHCLPIKYIAGKLMTVRALIGRLNLLAVDPATDFSFLQTQKFSFAAMVPHQVQKILDAEAHQGNLLQNIRNLLIGGSAIPYPLEKRLLNVPTACWSSYAMSETATHIALRSINKAETDEYYHCLRDIHVKASEDGCLEIYMPGLPEQPLKTTDLAALKDEITFKILGRADNIIISGGIKFSPEQLEMKLKAYILKPFLFTALPHESLGQQLVMVVKDTGDETATEQIKQICLKHLNKFEQPRKIIFVHEIPETGNGKPDRGALKKYIVV